MLTPPPGPLARLRAFFARAWHRATCTAPACLELFGAFQHPTPNSRALRP